MRSACLWVVAFSLISALTLHAQDRAKFEKEVKAAVKKFQETLQKQDASVDDKVAAVKEVAKLKHEKVLESLTPYLQDGPISVRIATAREMAGFGPVKGSVQKLISAYSAISNNAAEARGVRITILRSLGDMKAREAVDFVNGLMADDDAFIAKAAIDAAGKMRVKSSIEKILKEYDRIEGKKGEERLPSNPLEEPLPTASTNPMDHLRGERNGAAKPQEQEEAPDTRRELLIPALNGALQSITKESHKDRKTWNAWWSQNKSRFRVID